MIGFNRLGFAVVAIATVACLQFVVSQQNSGRNNDLVFDLEQAPHLKVQSSQQDDTVSSWFLGKAHRVKRAFWDTWFSSTTKPTPTTKTTSLNTMQSDAGYSPSSERSFPGGEHRPTDRIARQSTDLYNSESGSTAGDRTGNDVPTKYGDDEDYENSGSSATGPHWIGFNNELDVDGSGNGDRDVGTEGSANQTEDRTVLPDIIDNNSVFADNKPRYYRIIFTILEPYKHEFADVTSHDFQTVARSLVDAIQNLYSYIPNRKSIQVISITEREPDMFTSKVTVDLGIEGYNDKEDIKNRFRRQIAVYNKIGDHAASEEDFNFREFEDDLPSCPVGQLPCGSGECVANKLRCDGVNNCQDKSDEFGCDEKFHCSEGEFMCDMSRCIPQGSRCDGLNDCSDGTDERNCDGSNENSSIAGPDITDPDVIDNDNDDTQTIPPFIPFETSTQQSTGSTSSPSTYSSRSSQELPSSTESDEILPIVPLEEPTVVQTVNKPSYAPRNRVGGTQETNTTERAHFENETFNRDEWESRFNGSFEMESNCPNNQFQCDGNQCVDNYRKCDGLVDCDDGYDEKDCDKRCTQNEFTCNDGRCIDLNRRCNMVSDCRDGEDEANCPCFSDEFTCSNGQCIDVNSRCDGKFDCDDETDEDACPIEAKSFHRCASSSKQIPRWKLCDGHADCPKMDDEDNCKKRKANICGARTFKCSTIKNFCVPMHQRCDGINNCQDGSDELNCAGILNTTESKAPPSNLDLECHGVEEFTCANGTCINIAKRCNSKFDCPNGEDEDNCESQCPENFVRCLIQGHNTTCLTAVENCPWNQNCYCWNSKVYSTESSRETSEQSAVCKAHEFKCDDGECITSRYRCDGVSDCSDHSDENGCDDDDDDDDNYSVTPEICESDEMNCPEDPTICAKRCNQEYECPSGVDEDNCTNYCTPTHYRCANNQCIDENLRCNGRYDCADGSDEADCVMRCPPDQFRCRNGVCMDIRRRCDGVPDCGPNDSSDEENCPKRFTPNATCGADEFQCLSDKQCIPMLYHCDGRPDCIDHSDERKCPCRNDEFQCRDGTCISNQRVCNGAQDCPDQSDEDNCCQDREFRCTSGECIQMFQFCDGRVDCKDMSDENRCPSQPINFTTPRPWGGCAPGEWTCRSGQCISSQAVCDGRMDCNDFSDERDCNAPEGGLKLVTYPDEQIIKESRDVVFICRDEGPLRAKVHWVRANGQPLPSNSRDLNGRLEITSVRLDQGGSYVCEAYKYPASTAGSRKTVFLTVEPFTLPPTSRPATACSVNEATCSNGACIPSYQVCDGRVDCSDGSDEMRCGQSRCEPNQFMCKNKKCILKGWRCDGEDDCGDRSDEQDCATNPPGSSCRYDEFECRSGNQCIPKSYHCDLHTDCKDMSDEVGCSDVTVSVPPPPAVSLLEGDTFNITCIAVGIPPPEINWRLNWGHIPSKCTTTSVRGVGVLTCRNVQAADQGAYSCEAINNRGRVLATPDAILTVTGEAGVCPAGTFNEDARGPAECISCFCFGATDQCKSANLFTFQLPPPFDSHKLAGVRMESGQTPVIQEQPNFGERQRIRIVDADRYGVHVESPYGGVTQNGVHPYFALPDNYIGSQLKSYGGYLKYTLKFRGQGSSLTTPDVILAGNGYILAHTGAPKQSEVDQTVSVRFFEGEWQKYAPTGQLTPASRAEIMMALASVNAILIKVSYHDGPLLDTTIRNINMDSAAVRNTGLGRANYVEECTCPFGYTGLSCEKCASGFKRQSSGPWLGRCFEDVEPRECEPGHYGDPMRGIPCQVCPCPLTTPSNQFARTCSLGSDNQPICDCIPGYVGKRCDQCAPGYTGNPMQPGDSCRPELSQCDLEGSMSPYADRNGQCPCKTLVTGPTCNQCQPNSFYLSSKNQFGCISCFCMGITRQCRSSNLYRDQLQTYFTRSLHDFSIVESLTPDEPITEGLILNNQTRNLNFNSFSRRQPDVYYWSLPSRYLGDKLYSYGGNLQYSLSYVPLPGGLSSRNTAPDVQLRSKNDITLNYFNKEQPQPNVAQNFSVPLVEQYWQRTDGQTADREHMLMTLADVESILIKATYTTSTKEANLISVTLDTADERNTGSLVRALEVEQCYCPAGYRGLSCEDCDVGYKRAGEGLYLGLCEPCDCNGHSGQCDPETGECLNCADFTTGANCDQCLPGYSGNATRGTPYDCTPTDTTDQPCICDPAGSTSQNCVNDQCKCKTNVIGPQCDRCRPKTFALSASNPEGCTECFCSGVTDECHDNNLLYTEQIPMLVYGPAHGFVLVDLNSDRVVTNGFSTNVALNEIGYEIITPEDRTGRLYWSLPQQFTGARATSYGGYLTYTMHYTDRNNARPEADEDIIITGNGIKIGKMNLLRDLEPGQTNIISAQIIANGDWKRLELHAAPRPASREDILLALSNVESILIRGTQTRSTESFFISDVSLDTALPVKTKQNKALAVEICRCPEAYKGTSCEQCNAGYYRDVNDRSEGPLGKCKKCPCNGQEESCALESNGYVKCICAPGFYGANCEESGNGLRINLYPHQIQKRFDEPVELHCEYTNSNQLAMLFSTKGRVLEHNPYENIYIEAPVYKRNWFTNQVTGRTRIRMSMPNETMEVFCNVSNQDGWRTDIVGSVKATLVPVEVNGPSTPPPYSTDNPYSTVGPTAYPPTIVVTITDQKIQILEVGGTARFNCSGRSLINPNYPINVKWLKPSGSLPVDRSVTDSSGILIITDVRPSDSGTYVCQARDLYNVVEDTVTLNVGGGTTPPQVIISPRNLEVDEGGEIRMQCVAHGSPAPTLRWSRVGNAPLNPQHTFQNGIFHVPYASRTDHGVYSCSASNPLGEDSVDTRIYVRTSGTPAPPQQTEPVIYPHAYDGLAGRPFTLTCSTPNHRDQQIQWLRPNGESLPGSASSRGGTLIVFTPQPSDSGIYICEATVDGKKGRKDVMVSIRNNAVPPVAHVDVEQETIAQGHNFEVRCTAEGDPKPQIQWTKTSGELPPHVRSYDGLLTITAARIEDRGIYVCSAENEAGTSQATIMIEVESREPPRVELYPDAVQIVRVNGYAMLQCRVMAGIPRPEVEWTRENGQPITSEHVEILQGGTLRFNRITKEDAGQYRCQATNAAGQTSAVASIEIQAPPVIVISPKSGVLYVREGQSVRLVCNATGEPAPSVEWQTPRREIYDTAAGEYPVYGSRRLEPFAVHQINSFSREDEGLYVCSAQNSAGTSQERVQLVAGRGDIPITDDTSQEFPPGPPSDEYQVNVGGSIEIRCRIQGPTPYRIEWGRQDRRDLPPNARVAEGVLYISNAQKSDEGEYVCLVFDSRNQLSSQKSAYLTVPELPRIQLNPPRQIVKPGDNASILCTATGDQPMDISWTALGRDLPRSVRIRNGDLQFNRIAVSDQGRYKCTARNPAGEADSVAEVLVDADVTGPRISAVNREQFTHPGTNMRLECRPYGNATSSVIWRKENDELPLNARVHNDVLEIINVDYSNAGRYLCEIDGPQGRATDYINLIVDGQMTTTPRPGQIAPLLQIRPSLSMIHVGDSIDLLCTGANPGSQIIWSKDGSTALPGNTYVSESLLRISDVRLDNTGLYRCQTTDGAGVFDVTYYLNVDDVPENNKLPEIIYAPYGQDIGLHCRSDLSPPLTYNWTKQHGVLPKEAQTNEETLKLFRINDHDGGIYVCSNTNGRQSIETPIILVVTDVLPHFTQTPVSYLSYRPIAKAYMRFSIEISFRPETAGGLILYNSYKGASKDFISLALVGGVPEFRFNCGSGVGVITGDRPLELNKWHTIKLSRTKKQGIMYVDGHGPFQGSSAGPHQGLDLDEPLFIGGVPLNYQLAPDAGTNVGFVGCISRLVINKDEVDLINDAQNKEGISSCKQCENNPCRNNGVCQEARTKDGVSCICPVGLSGPTCERSWEACFPGLCGEGRCINKNHGNYECACPFGKAGPHCEQDIIINEPAFSDDAFIAYPTPKNPKKLKMALKFNAADVKDGILLYCGETDEGDGDFTSLAIKDRHLEFKFDMGNGPVTVRSEHELEPNKWVTVSAAKAFNEGKLIVNGHNPVTERSRGGVQAFNLQTPLYVGGYDKERIKINQNVGVDEGFYGCISGIEVTGMNLDLITSVTDSANVQDCSTIHQHRGGDMMGGSHDAGNDTSSMSHPCDYQPCFNEGTCYPTSPTDFSCVCNNGFSGPHCQSPPNICDRLRPCQNGGTCRGTQTDFKCDCPFRWTGQRCELANQFNNEIEFHGDGYLELPRQELVRTPKHSEDVIAISFATNSSNGLLFWHGQNPDVNGRDQDYLSIAVANGYVEFSWHLGSDSNKVVFDDVLVDDGRRHITIVKRMLNIGSLEVDNMDTKFAESSDRKEAHDRNGNIYLGGLPNLDLMTGGKYTKAFDGAIYDVEFQNERSLNLGNKAIGGVNVKPTERRPIGEDEDDDEDEDDFDNGIDDIVN